MDCPNINGLKLDQDDLNSIEIIRNSEKAGNMLQIVMPAGALSSIFLGNNVLKSTYNIFSFEFAEFARAMTKINALTRKTMEREAQYQYITSTDSEQKAFWKAIYEGCKL